MEDRTVIVVGGGAAGMMACARLSERIKNALKGKGGNDSE